MTDDKPQKINIGFDGGQVLSARVKPESWPSCARPLAPTAGTTSPPRTAPWRSPWEASST